MPIEFRCPNCSKLLRTPDQSAGKKAKCPQCGGIADVPLASDPGALTAAPGPRQPSSPVPPGMPENRGEWPAGKPAASPFASAGSANPYASPGLAPTTPTATLARGTLTHTKITFDRVLEPSWKIFRATLGQLAVLGLAIVGANIVVEIASQVGQRFAASTREMSIMVSFVVVSTLLKMVIQTWITIGTAIYMLKAVRDENPSVNDLTRAGPFFVRGVLVQMTIALVCIAIFAICLAPAGIIYFATGEREMGMAAVFIAILVAVFPVLYVVYGWLLALYFVVDQDLGVLESLSYSWRFMAGNKMMAFLILLVVTLVGSIASLLTCCVGYIVFIPYVSLVTVAIYMSATGQPWGFNVAPKVP